ncbi:retroviral-like aspartic protease family protein [Chitinophaga barathri]|nr:retroviral-like aspartic protease family protein [Chitinophaga barathri]
MKPVPFLLSFFLLFSPAAFSQPVLTQKDFVLSKEGYPLFTKKQYIDVCKKDLGADKNSPEANAICECMVTRLDRRYTLKQIKAYEKHHETDAVIVLMKQDTLLAREFQQCYEAGSQANIFFPPAYARAFRDKMAERYLFEEKDSSQRERIEKYCDCAIRIMQKKKMTLKMLDELVDENALLSNEIRYNCGDILKTTANNTVWNAGMRNDISGPETDTVYVLQLQNSTKVKVKIGPLISAWTLDSGADDLLVSDSLVNKLMEMKLLSPQDFIGEGYYRVANDQPMQVKIYRLPQLQVGKFTLRNVILTANKDVRGYLLGKGFLNKFSRWTLDNRKEVLILEK